MLHRIPLFAYHHPGGIHMSKILIVEDERKIARFLEKQEGSIVKTIVVKNKLVNLIVK